MVPRRLLTLVLPALLTAACGGGTVTPEAAPSATVSATASGPACPSPAGPAEFPPLPEDFPSDFPAPAGAADAIADDADPAVLAVRFPSPLGLADATRFVVEGLPAAGYEIVGGDREPHEADIAFARGALRGQLRIAAVTDCTTFWLVQLVRPT